MPQNYDSRSGNLTVEFVSLYLQIENYRLNSAVNAENIMYKIIIGVGTHIGLLIY